MIIRKAQINDLESIFSLICELEGCSLDKEGFVKVYLHNISQANIHYLVMVELDREKIVGFVSVHIQHLLHHVSKIAEIQEIIVAKEFQGSGIGHRLFEKVKNISRENDCTQIEVCCNRKREKSHAFYEKLGMNQSHFKFTLELNHTSFC